jgi:hypothetical protein
LRTVPAFPCRPARISINRTHRSVAAMRPVTGAVEPLLGSRANLAKNRTALE